MRKLKFEFFKEFITYIINYIYKPINFLVFFIKNKLENYLRIKDSDISSTEIQDNSNN